MNAGHRSRKGSKMKQKVETDPDKIQIGDLKKIYVQVGDRVHIIPIPHSEVCMHMKVAGRLDMMVELVSIRSAQLINPDGTIFSAPIGIGEAGFYCDCKGIYYYGKEC